MDSASGGDRGEWSVGVRVVGKWGGKWGGKGSYPECGHCPGAYGMRTSQYKKKSIFD